MAIEIDIRIIGENTAQVVHELRGFSAHLSNGLGVGAAADRHDRRRATGDDSDSDDSNGGGGGQWR